jgi:hypothetical protein
MTYKKVDNFEEADGIVWEVNGDGQYNPVPVKKVSEENKITGLPFPTKYTESELIEKMRNEVVWTDKASMPIPLYKDVKKTLQDYQAMIDRVEDEQKIKYMLVKSYPIGFSGKVKAVQKYIRGEE